MNITDYKEKWQVDAGGQIYEGSFEEMAQWIFDGSILPQDMVKRGNLRWIEAQKVPALLKFFNAKERGEPPPVFTSTTDAGAVTNDQTAPTQNFPSQPTVSSNPFQSNFNQPAANHFQPPQNSFDTTAQNFNNQNYSQANQFSQSAQTFNEPAPHEFNIMPTAEWCSMHPEAPAAFLCGTCGNGFCPVCPKSYGGSVKICPFCGAMCKSVKEVQEKMTAAVQYERDLSQGFGIDDFFDALAYPFKYKTSLIFGAIMFALFTLGQSAASMANMFMAGAALICWMLTNMLSFGVLMNVVDNFAQGKVGGNFMPSFEDFSLWDDVVHPFFLFLATYIVSFGLLILFIVGIVYFSWTTFGGKPPMSFEEKINVAQYQKDKQEGKFYSNDPNQTAPRDLDEKKLQELQRELQNQRQKEMESVTGKTREQEESDRQEMMNNFFKTGTLAVFGAVILLLWGIFYYPAACLVAGYTKSFVATLNPSIGFETIKLLGVDYWKIFGMSIAIFIATVIIGVILELVFSPLHLPGMGNLPAKAIGGVAVFYFSVVYAVVLGFALYKNSDKLGLYKS